jgi:hypothetical protein
VVVLPGRREERQLLPLPLVTLVVILILSRPIEEPVYFFQGFVGMITAKKIVDGLVGLLEGVDALLVKFHGCII